MACQSGPIFLNPGNFWNPEEGTVIISIYNIDSVPFTYYLVDGGGDFTNPEEVSELKEEDMPMI